MFLLPFLTITMYTYVKHYCFFLFCIYLQFLVKIAARGSTLSGKQRGAFSLQNASLT